MGFLVVLLACIINGAFFLYFFMTSSFWVFFSPVCFFSSLFALCFSISNFIWFSLHTACLLTSECFVWSFGHFVKSVIFCCHVFRARLVTVFSLPLVRLGFVVRCLSFYFLFMRTTFNMYRPKCVCYGVFLVLLKVGTSHFWATPTFLKFHEHFKHLVIATYCCRSNGFITYFNYVLHTIFGAISEEFHA